ncbi:hypothetical protein ADK76_03510 [Streptomyces griseoflavus]|uniref:hypothetical protein n=1 Tax=Streptomyces rimosus TaxID=1927 RepID=UPI00067D3FCA|nr:hypothetical protein [Streptomyces rimosus]KOG66204.1 hypothetical protein ADK76_03510 [Streptomyces griseoflavus]
MRILTKARKNTRRQVFAEELAKVKPLPVWFFAFEGVLGAAYDLCHAWSGAWTVVLAFAAVNIAVGLTVLRRRIKLVKALLKNSRTRAIAFGLIAFRMGAHALLGAAGAQVASVAGHLLFAAVMGGATVALLWFDQRVTFRALGLAPARTTVPA